MTVAGAVLAAVLIPGLAGAGWKAPRNLSPAGEPARSPALAVAPNGAMVLAWHRFDGTQPPSTCCARIQAVVRRPNGKLGKVRTLSAPGQDARFAQAAIGSDGTAAVIWRRLDGSDPPSCCARAQVRVFRPGGGWGQVQTLSEAGESVNDWNVAVGRDGRAIAIWTREDPGFFRRLQVRIRPSGIGPKPRFRNFETLSPPGESAYSPHLGMAPSGAAAIVWQRFDGTHDRTVVKVRRPGRGFGARKNLSRPDDEADYHTVAVGPDGTTVAAWLVETAGLEYELEVRRRVPGGRFGPIVKLSGGANSGEPDVGIDSERRTTVAWEQLVSPEPRIAVRTARRGTSFGARRFLSPAGESAQDPLVAVSADGSTIVGWRHFDDSGPSCCGLAQARIRAPGKRRFGGQRRLSEVGAGAENMVVAIANRLRAFSAWDRSDGSDLRVQLAAHRR